MPNATLQLSQLLPGGAEKTGRTGRAGATTESALFSDARVKDGTGRPTDALADFQQMLAAMTQGRTQKTADALNALLAAAKAAGTRTQAGGTQAGAALADAGQSAAQILAVLQKLTPAQLAALGLKADALPDAQTLAADPDAVSAFLETLAPIQNLDASRLTTIIADPELAEQLAGALQNAAQAKTALTEPADDGALTGTGTRAQTPGGAVTVDFAALVQAVQTAGNAAAGAAAKDSATGTIDVAALDLDAFQALKKLSYADIAPFLTQPRVVRLDGNNVMKVAQGPAFLNDEGTDSSVMGLLAGLAGVVPVQAQLAQTQGEADPFAAPGATGGGAMTAQGETPLTGALGTTAAQAGNTLAAALSAELKGQGAASAPAGATARQTVNALTRAGVPVAKGLDSALDSEPASPLGGFEDLLHVHADQNTPASGTSTLVAVKSATQPHPSVTMVSAAMQRAAAGVPAGTVTERQFVIQVDPPSLGRLKITLEFDAKNNVKGKILAENPETVALLQKDAVMLERTLQNAGFNASAQGSLSFDLAQGDSFSQGAGGNGGNANGNQNKASTDDGTDFATIETVMPIFVDPATGMTRVNVLI